MLENGRRCLTGEVVKACLDVLGQKRGDFGSFCGACWGSAAMKGLECFFIAVTMVCVMLSFLEGKLRGSLGGSFAGVFLDDMGKGGMKKRAYI